MVHRATRRVLVAAALMGLAACAPAPTPTASPSVTPTETPSASPTPVTPSFSTEQQAAADLVVKFYEVQDQVGSNYEVPLDAFYEVAAGDLVAERLRVYQEYRGLEVRQLGRFIPDVREVTGQTEPFEVDVCVDSSGVDMVDAKGSSVISAESPSLVLHRIRVERVGEAFRAVSDEAIEAPC